MPSKGSGFQRSNPPAGHGPAFRRRVPHLAALAAACWLALVPACSRPTGVYHREGIKGDSLTLHEDGRFALRESGQTHSGSYSITGNRIVLVTETGEERPGKVESGVLYDPHGNRWLKR